MTLLPCPTCRRHVRTDEAACPFCASSLGPMAALLLAGAALAAGCGGKTSPATNTHVENAAIDGGVPDAAPPMPDAGPLAPDAEDMSRLKMPYGAPPVRTRAV